MAHEQSKMNPAIHILVSVVCLDLIGFGIIIPLLPLYAEVFHAGPRTIGLLMATFSFWQFLFAPILGRWSDRVGRRPVLLLSLAGTVLGYIPLAIANHFPQPLMGGVTLGLALLFLSRTLDGISGGNISTAQAYIADITTPEERIKGMGMIGAAFGIGFVLGPMFGSLLVRYGFGAPAIAALVVGLANWVVAYRYLPESWKPDSAPAGRTFSLSAIARNLAKPHVGMLILLVFVATFAFTNLEATFTLYLQDRLGVAPKEAAERTGYYFMYIGVLLSFIQGYAIRRLRGRNMEPLLVVGGTLSLMLGLFGMALTHSTAVLLLPLALIAFGSGFVNPSLTSLISQRSDPNEMGQTLGASQGMSGLARIIGPLIAGSLYAHHETGGILTRGPGLPYLFASAVMAAAFLMALNLHRQSTAKVETVTGRA